MADIHSALRSEITRLSTKVVKQFALPLRSASLSQRRALTDLRKQLAELERAVNKLSRAPSIKGRTEQVPTESKLRFRAQGFRKHRERLGLSAEDAGKLIGVSGQTVYNWEHAKATPRNSQLPAIAALRDMGKREARRRLDTVTEG